ncbi:MAG: response regulator [Zetaproteobacteria bacterium]|nr:response regulator [Zetaproteobacteria bacterium]
MVFEDKSAKIVTIESSGAVRQMLGDVIKSHEFGNITGVGSIKDALGVMEADQIDWVITPLGIDQDNNVFQLLKLITSIDYLRKVRVTALVDENELEYIPALYEHGLLFHILKPINKESFGNSIQSFLEDFGRYEWKDTRLAAHYLHAFLSEHNKHEDQIQLESSMISLFPGEIVHLLNTVQAYFKLNDQEKAGSILKQATILYPDKKEDIEKVGQELFGDQYTELADRFQTDAENPVNALGIQNCAIIDADDGSRNIVVQCLKDCGIPEGEIKSYDEGESAWKEIDTMESLDLIIMEWRIPKISGPMFIQRIRNKFPVVPIIVVSSLLTQDDVPLVIEMGVAQCLEKPAKTNDMVHTMLEVMKQDRNPSSIRQVEMKVVAMLEAGKEEEAAALRSKIQEEFKDSKASILRIDAHFCFAKKEYAHARDLALEVMRSQPDSIVMLNFIGKCLMQLRDFNAALQCFEKAQSISPKNIERLCAIAEMNSEMGNPEGAEKAISEAEQLDDGNESVQEKKAEIAISEGDLQKAKEVMENLSSLNSVISYMNNKAVASARSRNFEAGMELYKRTIESIPTKNKEVKAIVLYNLGLAYGRQDQWDKAKEEFDAVVALGKSRVDKKAKSLLTRIELAKRQNKPIVLNAAGPAEEQGGAAGKPADAESGEGASTTEESSAALENFEALGTVEITPGSLCCFRVFSPAKGSDVVLRDINTGLPRFKVRDAVKRAETGGADKMAKSAS